MLLHLSRYSFALCLLVGTVLCATSASGANLYFSYDPTRATWDNSTTVDWATTDGGPYTVSTWSSGSDAIFQGNAGKINITENITSVNSMTFAQTGYSLSGPGSITLTGSSINSGSGTATIGNALQGSVGLTKSGSGTLILTGNNTYTGGTTINEGTLQIGGPSDGYYRYYRFALSATNGGNIVQMSEFGLYSSGKDPSGTRVIPTGIQSYSGSYFGTEGPANLNDQNSNTKWCHQNVPSVGTPQWVVFDMGSGKLLTGYDWETANDSTPGRNPKDWVLQGSNDTSNWTTLDTQTNSGATPTSTFTWANGWAINPASTWSSGRFGTGTYSIASGATLRVYDATVTAAPTWANISGEGTLALNTMQAIDGSANWGAVALPSTFTGKLLLERGRAESNSTTYAAALGGTTSIEVKDGAQFMAWGPSQTTPPTTVPTVYNVPITLAGNGWGEGGQPGALRVPSNRVIDWAGNVTLAANAGIYVQDSGATMTVSGSITGNYTAILESNGTLTIAPASGVQNSYAATQIGSTLGGTGGSVVAGNSFAFSTGPLTMVGGTLKLNGNDFAFANLSGAAGTISNYGSYPSTMTVGSDNTSTTFSGTVTNGDATSAQLNVVKVGTGTLNLAGTNNFTGTIEVAGGTLNAVNLTGLNSVAVTSLTSGAMFAGSGTINDAAIYSTGGITGNPTNAGTLSVGSIYFYDTGTLGASYLNQTSPAVTVSTGLYTSGISNSVTVDIGGAGLPVSATPYIVATYAFTTDTSVFKLGKQPGHNMGYLVVTGTEIDYVVTGTDTPYWTGLKNNAWNTASTTPHQNWKLVSNNAETTYLIGDNVLFDNHGSAQPIVDIDVANVTPASVTVNSTSDYTFQSSGNFGIAGTATLTKSNTGTLTINTLNSYTGATAVNGGTLIATVLAANGSNSNIGAGTELTFDGGTLSYRGTTSTSINRNITINAGGATIDTYGTVRSQFLAVDGVLTGYGDLTKTGGGQMFLTADSSSMFSGNIFVNDGELQVRGTGNVGLGKITVHNGGSFVIASATNAMTISNEIELNGMGPDGGGALGVHDGGTDGTFAGTITLASDSAIGFGSGVPNTGAANSFVISGYITGSGGLTKVSPNNATLAGFLSNDWAGATVVQNGSLTLANSIGYAVPGDVQIGVDTGTSAGNLVIASGVAQQFPTTATITYKNQAGSYGYFTLNADQEIAAINDATGRGYVTGNNAKLTISGIADSNFAGVLQDASSTAKLTVIHSGSGALTLTGNNTLTGAIVMDNGTLHIGAGGTGGTAGFGEVQLNTPDTKVVFNRSDDSSAIAKISGLGSLEKKGAGTLVVCNEANSYAGPTVISGGTLKLAPINSVSGFGGNGLGWNVNSQNVSTAPVTSDVLTLTDGQESEARSAFYNAKVPVGSFSASFVYQGAAAGNGLADGIAFIMQNDTRNMTALGGGGGSLGYSGITPSAAVEFNIYGTAGTALNTNGATGGYSTTDTVNVGSGHPILVSLAYDSAALTLTETLTDQTTLATWSKAYSGIDLASLLGGNFAYLGFSGATGGQTAVQTISNFQFNYNGPAVQTSFLPATTAVSITVAGGKLDLGSNTQAIASLAGVAGTSVELGAGTLITGDATPTVTFAGDISGVGGSFVKQGSGEQILSGNLTYTGSTKVIEGTLSVGDLLHSTNVSVYNNAVLSARSIACDTLSIGGTSTAMAVPEPGTMTLLVLAGLASLGLYFRRK